MKILKSILFIVLGLVALALITALFVKKEFSIERTITINKPKAEVFQYLRSIRHQNEEWGPWAKKDPNIKIDYLGTESEVGSISKWSGNSDVGMGEQEIKKIVPDEYIECELRFKEPMEATHKAYYKISGDSTKAVVVWGMEGRSSYPWNIFNLFMNGIMAKDFDQGADNLKKQLEK